ncbi:MAG: HAMP domain-containing sensor histidine kinase, partial [Chloroflexota bacterium]
MNWLKIPNSDSELNDLMRSTGRKLIYTVAGLYLAGHIIATLGLSEIFSPGIWILSTCMLLLVLLCLRLIEHRYFLSQLLWLGGLASVIVLAFFIYSQDEVVLLLMVLPLIAVVTLGIPGAVISVIFVMVVANILLYTANLPSIYGGEILLGSIAIAIFGWGLSSNLLNALDAASFHYHEARRFLAETQNHRAEISRMLKDRNQVNYQLERLNEMLTFARAQAEEARENRNRFMLAVSHELRSPLNFIIGFSDLMVNAPETYAPLNQWPSGLYNDVQEVYTSSNHLMRLINDILDMGKIDAGQMSLYREKAQMDQIVADVRDMLSGAFEQKGITLAIELPPDLPSILVDTTRIRQVLLNLLNNGLRFTDHGEVRLKIERTDTHLLLSVTDTGVGIAPEDMPKVFEEFRQIGEENWRRRAGSGLGLYISRHFVELHGGSMNVESTLGHGTCFSFTLPFDSPETDISVFYDIERPSSRNPRILVITPHPEDVDVLRRPLDGYELQPVLDAEQAKEKTRELFPRAILVAADANGLLPANLP